MPYISVTLFKNTVKMQFIHEMSWMHLFYDVHVSHFFLITISFDFTFIKGRLVKIKKKEIISYGTDSHLAVKVNKSLKISDNLR